MTNTERRISILGCIIWLIAALFFMYEFMLRTFVGSIADQVIPALHLTAESFALLGTGYYIAYALMQIPVGILVDRFGVKAIMFVAILLCALATLLFAHSGTFLSAFASRVFMGFGSSFAFVCLLVIVMTWFPKRFFAFFAGMSQFVGTLGPLLAGGPLVAVMTGSHESWRLIMSLVASFGIILAVLVLLVVRNGPARDTQKVTYLSHDEPLLTQLKRLFTSKQAWAIALYSGLLYVSAPLLGAIWGTDYLEVKGFSQDWAATLVSMVWAGYAIGCPLLGALSDLLKLRKPVLITAALFGLSATLGIIFIPGHSTWVFGVLFLLLGLAASGQNVAFAIMSEHVDKNIKATAMGLNNGTMVLAGAIMPLLVSFTIHLPASGIKAMQPSNFTFGFLLMPLLMLLAILIAVFTIHETYARPQFGATIVMPE